MYDATVGDRVRRGDTNLPVEVEHDDVSPGDEAHWGFGKTNRSPRTC
jgi:urease subunit alpha